MTVPIARYLAISSILGLPTMVHANGLGLAMQGDFFLLFGLPLMGAAGITLLMLANTDTRRILGKALLHCVFLMALVAVVAMLLLNTVFGLMLLALAPWFCFLVLLRGFIASALGDWDKR